MRKGAFPEIVISPQVLLTCDLKDGGCHGGNHYTAYQWIHDNYITDTSCAPYQALSHYEGLKCDAQAYCKECSPDGKCFVPKVVNKYNIEEFGKIPADQESLKNEIYARGPIACGVNAGPIVNATGEGVFTSDDKGGINHVISVAGWGEEADGTPYWVMRNSWGEYWADEGYLKVYRGNNTVRIEQDCVYAVPKVTWENQTYPTNDTDAQKAAETPSFESLISKLAKSFIKKEEKKPLKYNFKPCLTSLGENSAQVVLSPKPEDYLEINDIPTNYFYGDIDGENYQSWTLNQHLPQYCGSCWAQAALSAFADRINFIRKPKKVALSPQVLINCYGGGSCNGGSLDGPYQFGHKKGIPEMGCQVYTAKNPEKFDCSDIQQCMNCKWNPDFSSQCWAVTKFKRWFVAEYGSLKGPSAMKKEIFARGPITCGMHVTDKFEEYTGGIYSEKVLFDQPNHAISVCGWGVDKKSGTEYWIVRNSWGTQFGENGYFKIQMHKDNLGIDSHSCWWATPKMNQEEEVLTE